MIPDSKRELLAQKLRQKVASSREQHPVSQGQAALLFLNRLLPRSPAYNLAFVARVVSEVDTDALERALQRLVDRHDVLRTTYAEKKGSPCQIVHGTMDVHLSRVNASGWTEAELNENVRKAFREPYDLSGGPVFRALLYSRSPVDHVFLFGIHHIATDGWSLGIIVEELRKLYGACHEGGSADLPPVGMSYTDTVRRRSEVLEGKRGDDLWTYWQKALGGDLLSLDLPTDFPRPAIPSMEGDSCPISISEECSRGLKELARSEGVTFFSVLLAAFQVLLMRYTGKEDILVGTPMAGRSETDFERVVGYFVNAVVIRGDLSGNPSFREFVRKFRDVVVGALTHQDFPFSTLVERLRPVRDAGGSSILQVMFNLLSRQTLGSFADLLTGDEASEPAEFGGMRLKPFPLEQQAGAFDVELELVDSGVGCKGSVKFSTELFTRETVERMAAHFASLVQGIVNDPDRRINEIPMLTETETRHLMVDWKGGGTSYVPTTCVHQLFEAQARRAPDSSALSFNGVQVTYRQLNRASNRLAALLQREGAGPESLLAIYAHRSLELVIGILAILKSGAAYLPLDPMYPRERLGFILEDAKTPVILTERGLLDTLPPHSARVVLLDDAISESVIQDSGYDENPQSGVNPSNLAYVIYTSGSTGKPKGVLVTHANVARLFDATEEWFHFKDTDVWTLFHSCAFDFSVWEIWGALTKGGRLVIVPYEVSRSPKEFRDLLIAEHVTVLNQTPSAFLQLVGVEQSAPIAARFALRVVVFGGEALNLQSLRPWIELHGDENPRLVNMYGITETTVHVTYRPITSQDVSSTAGSMIGIPLPDLELYVLDRNRQLMPVGLAGELYVGGGGVARGYLNRPELTSERFVANPFSGLPGARLYKTGDVARFLSGGDLEYLGRIDDQVQIRGFRVELGEIEAALMEHGSLRQAAVLFREDGSGEKVLVAYVVPEPQQVFSHSEIRRFLSQRLPEYMIPQYTVELPALPLTSNGKVDRRALPEPVRVRQTDETFVVPRNGMEKDIARIWGDVLHLSEVGVHDNFFDLGGNSLLLSQALSRLQEEFPVTVTMVDLFHNPTIESLAKFMSRSEIKVREASTEGEAAREAILARPAERAPLSFSQLGVWFHQRLQPSSTVYNISFAARIDGSLDSAALTGSLQAVIQRHSTLRTVFSMEGDQPIQRVLQSMPLPLSTVDLTGVAPSALESRLQRALKADADALFDIEKGPLVRFVLYIMPNSSWTLSITMQHLVSDGWSFGVFLKELGAVYNARSHRTHSELAPLQITYGDFAHWQRTAWADSPQYAAHQRYWKDMLSAAPPVMQLPTDYPRPDVSSYAGDTVSFTLASELTAALKKYCKTANATPFMLFLATLRVLLYRYTGQSDTVIGFPVANRVRKETEGLIGDFINTVALRTILPPDCLFETALETVKSDTVKALAHQEYPFENLVRELHPPRSASYHPVFQILMAYQNTPPLDFEMSGCQVSVSQTLASGSLFDLVLEVNEDHDDLSCRIGYSTDLFSKETILRVAEHFRNLLTGAVRSPAQPISRLPFLSAEEFEREVRGWNATAAEYPRGKRVHDLVREQALRTPDKVAVVCGERRVTYRQLMERAEQVARFLRGLEVGAGKLVGICLERSVEIVVAILGVLMAGGAYVPLDPGFPAERLALMVEDAECLVILTLDIVSGCLPRKGVRIVDVSRIPADGRLNEAGNEAEGSAGPEDLAYVMYTSGSTGKPKGVEIPHRAVVNFLCSMQREPGLTGKDNLLSVTTISFDIFGLELFLPLVTGACMTIVTREIALDGRALQREMEKSRATVMQATPATWRLLLESGWKRAAGLKVLCGGEALSRELADRILETGAELWNMYGPTETTIWSATGRVHKDGKPISIGRPIANTQLHVLDPDGNPLPAGVPGQLHIGGHGLARGYRGRSDLTSRSFIPDPFTGEAGARLYRTGDLVRREPEGSISFLGRIDTQVKIRGYRIELGDIESHLNQHPDIKNCVVAVQEDKPERRRLVAYYVPSGHSRPGVRELREFLSGALPDYMIPAVYVCLDAFPLTPNGKIDRKALPKLDGQIAAPRSDRVAPRDETEEELAKIWEKVLGVQRVSVSDDFFELGGDSLLAARLFAEVGNRLRHHLPLATLFRYPTIEGIAKALHAEDSGSQWSVMVPIHSEGSRPPLFLVHGAEGNVLLYRSLQRHLGDDQRVYGLQSEGLDGRAEFQPTIESMAATYVEAVRKIQPKGPYYFGGFCMGGTVALEMAQQLQRDGDEVALLAMFETYNMDTMAPSQGLLLHAIHTIQNGLFHFLSAFSLHPGDRSLFLKEKGDTVRMRLKMRNDDMRARIRSLMRREGSSSYRHVLVRKGNDDAQQRYHPQPYDGRLTLFRPQQFFAGFPHRGFGWEGIPSKGIDVHVLPLYPRTMLVEPFVRVLAERLKECMQKAQLKVTE